MSVRRGISRTVLGLLAAAMSAMLLASVAQASPETDADAAINQAWEASGGAESSPLGPKDGGIYPAGAGFGQNFLGGAIFFTPDAGAKIMRGAILDKYQAMGGPTGDLGFPNIDEGPGKVSPDSRNTTFSAGDNPVIFWTPDTGAWVVRGPINAAWDKLGGSAGVLGVPIADESYDGQLVSQKFTGGQVSFDRRSKAFTTTPPELAEQLADLNIPTDASSSINTAWRAAGGVNGPLGAKQGDQYPIGDGGIGQNFAGGKVYYSAATDANAVTGQILAKYEDLGGPAGSLGFPSAAEADGGAPGSKVTAFSAPDAPVIFWTPDHGAVVVRGAMNAAWGKLGGATGQLGVPLSDQTASGDTIAQKFSGGEISWDKAKNTFSTQPAELAQALSGLEVPGANLPIPPGAPAPEVKSDKGFLGFFDKLTWNTAWLWWIIPLGVLILASVTALVWWMIRRGRHDSDVEYADEDEYDHPTGYGSAPEPPGHWAPDSDPNVGPGRFANLDEPPGYSPPTPGWPDSEAAAAGAAASRWGATSATAGPSTGPFAAAQAPHGAHESADFDADDADAIDTTPNRVHTDDDDDDRSGRHSVWTVPDDMPPPGSLFAPVYGAAPPPATMVAPEEWEHDIADHEDSDYKPELFDDTDDADERDHEDSGADAAEGPAIHLPLEDPYEAPRGYPIKGNLRRGVYFTPGSASYRDALAEIWFASEELAQASGLVRAD